MNTFELITHYALIVSLCYLVISYLVNGSLWLNFFVALALGMASFAVTCAKVAVKLFYQIRAEICEQTDLIDDEDS